MSYRRCILVLACFVVAGVMPFVHAADVSTAIDNSGCVACHARSEARIGPPYTAIAARYADSNEQTIARLAQKILRGGAGNWGVVPMIPHDTLDPQQAHAMVRWILQQGTD